MDAVFHGFMALFTSLPLSALEFWGLAGYSVGWVLLVIAYGGFQFRSGGKWSWVWRQQTWNDKAFKAALTTFIAIMVTGYLGSFIVLVPGAQTLESLKDLSVFVCTLIFGYPALLVVPFAYGLSDLIEGVPPDFLLAWLPGYWINPSCFWIAFLLFGRNPDFRKAATWWKYLLFVVAFEALEPPLWGFICDGKFPGGISYYQVTPALFFTTAITWLLAPWAMLVALPAARKAGWFWAEISGHVRTRDLAKAAWVWESGPRGHSAEVGLRAKGIPIRLALALPFLALLLTTVGISTFVALSSAQNNALSLASKLHSQMTDNLLLELDNSFETRPPGMLPTPAELKVLLDASAVARQGRVYVWDKLGSLVASSGPPEWIDPVYIALQKARVQPGAANPDSGLRFDVITAHPLAHESWTAMSTPYQPPAGDSSWLVVTVLPASTYLQGIQTGSSQSALVVTWALALALLLVVILTGGIMAPLERIARASSAVASGDWAARVPPSRIRELALLTSSFNTMAERIHSSVDRISGSEANFRSIFEGSIEGFYRSSPEGKLLMANPAMARVLGYPSAEVMLATVTDMALHWRRPDARKEAMLDIAEKGVFDGLEVEMVKADGTPIWVQLNGRLVRPETASPYYEGVLLDITERRRAADELQAHRDHLEELVDQRTKELETARDAANTANRAKSQFLANMSHEIRTPMNAVLGFAQLLGHDESLSPQARQRVETIRDSGEHLLAIIDEILEMARIEAGRIERRDGTVDLKALLDDLATMFRMKAEEKGLTFHVEVAPGLPSTLVTDPGRLRQILVNLLGNAVKYTTHGGVDVRATSDGFLLVVEVRDTGVGLEQAELESIFTPFERAGRGAQTAGGTGLGLSISRQYAQLLGGTIAVESTPGVGSLFVLSLPVQEAIVQSKPVTATVTQLPRLEAGQEGTRILVVDDQETNRDLLRAYLEPLGFVIDEAPSGEIARDRVLENVPRIVLLDLRMPGWSGYETAKQLRALPGGDKLVILGVSASVLDQNRKEFQESGIDGFLPKPFLEKDLFDLLTNHGGIKFASRRET